ncbi:MAG: hypothetical protein KJ939_06875 [Nanoarchaeota archaeon]|nr:hypothetical protein [Nanoarchaeota archaeon]
MKKLLMGLAALTVAACSNCATTQSFKYILQSNGIEVPMVTELIETKKIIGNYQIDILKGDRNDDGKIDIAALFIHLKDEFNFRESSLPNFKNLNEIYEDADVDGNVDYGYGDYHMPMSLEFEGKLPEGILIGFPDGNYDVKFKIKDKEKVLLTESNYEFEKFLNNLVNQHTKRLEKEQKDFGTLGKYIDEMIE